ncbi:growth hormone secretagogue receptor 1a [Elysia marginata]|uniref:Growth hormone secretagogue receptor 1a n=1 Tax=Elysia marginata TaxID=1093978 RepID=A0AAV4I6H4_9GAST|nr:growth hormone secretagogue receptor 1a [Elysia marginata]
MGFLQATQDLDSVVTPVISWCIIATGLSGTCANILTILVFRKLGFSTNIHISYTALAVSDLGCVLFICVAGLHALLDGSSLPSAAKTSMLLRSLAGVLSRRTSLITAWISLERCVGVVFPTRVKLLITRPITIATLVAIFIITFVPVAMIHVVKNTVSDLNANVYNSTSTTLSDSGFHSTLMEELREGVLVLFSVVIPLLSWLCVAVCTVTLSVKLRASARWRRHNCTNVLVTGAAQHRHETHRSTRADRATKKVIVVAVVFLVCSLPAAGHTFTSFMVRDFSEDGALRYIHQSVLMAASWVTQINGSINLVIFTAMGLRFRNTLTHMISLRVRASSTARQ